MTLHRLLTTAFVALAFTVPSFAAEETPLEKEMEKLNKALKAVGRAAKEGTVGKELVAKVNDAKTAAEASLKLDPAKTADVPAGEKEKFLTEYKASMQDTIKALDELKVAVEAGKAADVTKIIDKLNAQKKEGHKKFQKEE